MQVAKHYFLENGPYFQSVEHLIDYYKNNADGIPVKLIHGVKAPFENDVKFMVNCWTPEYIQREINYSIGCNLKIEEEDVILYNEIGSGNFGKVEEAIKKICTVLIYLYPFITGLLGVCKDSEHKSNFCRQKVVRQQ